MGDSAHRFQSIMHSDSLYTKMTPQPLYKDNPVDPELEQKARKVSDKISETVNVIANEPSLAFYRIQEHVRKTLPQLVDQKHEVEDIQTKVQGACFDAEYATNAVKAMQNSAIHFQNIQDLLKNAMFMKQQISYEEARRKQEALQAAEIESSSSEVRNEQTLQQQEERRVHQRHLAEETVVNREVERYMTNT